MPPALEGKAPETVAEVALRLELEKLRARYRNYLYLGIVAVIILGLMVDHTIRARDRAIEVAVENEQKVSELIKRAYRADQEAHAQVVERFPVVTKSRLPKKIRRFENVPIVQQSIDDNVNIGSRPLTTSVSPQASAASPEINDQTNQTVDLSSSPFYAAVESDDLEDTRSSTSEEPDVQKVDVGVSLYALRSRTSAFLGVLSDREDILSIKQRDDWSQLMLAGSATAWIYSAYVEELESYRLRVTGTRVGLRSQVDQSKEYIVGLADTGDTLEIVEQQGDWYRVVVPAGFDAWASTAEVQSLQKQRSQNTVTLYAKQSIEAIVMGELQSASTISAREPSSQEWTSLTLEPGLPVWISSDYVAQRGEGRIVVTASRVGLRVRPQPNKRLIVGIVDTGDILSVIGQKDGWYRVYTPSDFKVWAGSVELNSLPDQS